MRVIINDIPGTEHADGVRTAAVYGYNATFDKIKYPDIDVDAEVVVMNGSLSDIFNYGELHPEVIAVARSTTGVSNYVNTAKLAYPHIQTFMPMGSNSYIELKIFTEPEPPVIATCGCGDDETRNNTAWGNGLEFWDTDWTWVGGQDASSYANGWICGKIWRIYDELVHTFGNSATWWWARWLARETAWRIEPNRPKNPDGTPVKWHIMNGYGRINLDEALNMMTVLKPPVDPYLDQAKLGQIGKLDILPYGAVKITFKPVENAVKYAISRNDVVIKEIKANDRLEYVDVLYEYGTYYYSYRAIGQYEQTPESAKVKVAYFKGDHPKVITIGIPAMDIE